MYHRTINAVHVEATDRCNAQCPVCIRSYQGGPVRSYVKDSELGLKHFTEYLGNKFISNIGSWNFCGNKGDPSSALELVEIFEYILKCNPETKIDMRTNGGARGKNFWVSIGELFEGTQCRVIFAVDGLEDTNHIYRKNVKWKNLWRNMEAYFENGGHGLGQWDFLKFKHNEHQIDELKYLAERFNIPVNVKEPYGFTVGKLGLPTTIPVYDRNLTKADGISTTNDKYKLLYTIKPATDEYEDADYPDMSPKDIIESRAFYDYNNERLFEYSDAKIDCIVNQPKNDHAEIFLDCDGSVYPCCFIGSRINIGEKQLEMMVGDSDIVLSKENTIHNILDSKYFQKTMPDGINGNFTEDLTLDNKTNHCITCVDCCGMKMELSHRR